MKKVFCSTCRYAIKQQCRADPFISTDYWSEEKRYSYCIDKNRHNDCSDYKPKIKYQITNFFRKLRERKNGSEV